MAEKAARGPERGVQKYFKQKVMSMKRYVWPLLVLTLIACNDIEKTFRKNEAILSQLVNKVERFQKILSCSIIDSSKVQVVIVSNGIRYVSKDSMDAIFYRVEDYNHAFDSLYLGTILKSYLKSDKFIRFTLKTVPEYDFIYFFNPTDKEDSINASSNPNSPAPKTISLSLNWCAQSNKR